jgi:hypothetical protein
LILIFFFLHSILHAIHTCYTACGTCSSAQDFGVVITHIDTLQDETLLCSTLYTLNPQLDERFATLQECFYKLGFSESCGTLWAHFSAANVALCTESCFPDPTTGEVVLNGPPPTCSLESCLTCSLPFQLEMSDIAGFTMPGAGIREDIARPCSTFFRVEHDPCVGASSTPVPEATVAPVADAASRSSELLVVGLTMVVRIMVVILCMAWVCL